MSAETQPQTLAAIDHRSLVEELRCHRGALHHAELDLGRIPELLAAVERSQANQCALEEEAQSIRDRCRDARLNLQQVLQRLVEVLQVQAVHNETVRFVLKEIKELSPHPSVRVADQALALVHSLDGLGSPVAQHQELDKLQPLAPERPTSEDRRHMAARIDEAMMIHRDNLKSARGKMEIAEGTFNRLRAGEPVQPSNWRKARAYVESAFTGPSKA